MTASKPRLEHATFDRHVETVAQLDVVAAATLVGLAAWLVGGLPFSVNPAERAVRLVLGGASANAALFFFILWAAISRRSRIGRGLQLGTAVLLLPLVPVGSAWGGYVLWALTRPEARAQFVRGDRRAVVLRQAQDERSRSYRPVIAVAVAIGILVLTAGAPKAREIWLRAQVAQAASDAASRQDAISRRLEQLRRAGILDTGEAPDHGSRAPGPRR